MGRKSHRGLTVACLLSFALVVIRFPLSSASETNQQTHVPEYEGRTGRFLSKLFEAVSSTAVKSSIKSTEDPARRLGTTGDEGNGDPKVDQQGVILPKDGSLPTSTADSSSDGVKISSNRTKDQLSSEEAINSAAKFALQALNKTINNDTLTVEEQMLYKFFMKGKDLLTREDSPLRQIFPFNPYIAYGPFLTIPMWVLMGMYIKLLKKTKEFYSSAYRIDFWKKKPLGLKGYYLHPAYYPVERVPILGPAQYHQEEGYGKPGYGDTYKPSGMEGYEKGGHNQDYLVENTYNLPPDMPLYVDEDTVLPSLPDGADEEYFRRRQGDVALRRRTGFAPTSKGTKQIPASPGSREPVARRVEAAVTPVQRRRRRNDQMFARRIGSPVIGSQASSFGAKSAGNLPWGIQRRPVHSTTAAPALPLQSLFKTVQAETDLRPTTWRPSLAIRRQQQKFLSVRLTDAS